MSSNAFTYLSWMNGSSTIPIELTGLGGICSEYDQKTNDIYLFYQKQSFRYNIDDDIFYPLNISLSQNIVCSGQASTKIDDVIYMNSNGPAIASYNIATNTFKSSFATPPWSTLSFTHYQCYTQLNNRYLILLGGKAEADYNKNFRIYDMMDGIWTKGPDIPDGRSGSGCLIYNNYLYIAGTTSGNLPHNIFKIYVGDMEQISNSDWVTLNGTIYGYVLGGRLSVYDEDIYFVGDDGIIDVIDTETEKTDKNISQTIDYSTNAAVMVINNKIYAFGGRNGKVGNVNNLWQYALFSTTSIPTSDPTKDPTYHPTNDTIIKQTVRRTNEPTMRPIIVSGTDKNENNDTSTTNTIIIVVVAVVILIAVIICAVIIYYKKFKVHHAPHNQSTDNQNMENVIEGKDPFNVITGELDVNDMDNDNNDNDNEMVSIVNQTYNNKMSESYKLLTEWKLSEYHEVLVEQKGYDDIEDWKDLTVNDLQGMGFKEGHSKRFVRKVQSIQSA